MRLLYAEEEYSLSEAVVDILTYHRFIVDPESITVPAGVEITEVSEGKTFRTRGERIRAALERVGLTKRARQESRSIHILDGRTTEVKL